MRFITRSSPTFRGKCPRVQAAESRDFEVKRQHPLVFLLLDSKMV